MGPKKKAPARASSTPSDREKTAAELRLSAGNEAKLRRLLQNNAAQAVPQQQQELSEGERKVAGRRLRAVYDSLANEGFPAHHIQEALAAIPVESATLEAALDWLCLNLPPDQLPLKYASGNLPEAETRGVSVQVLSIGSSDRVPAGRSVDEVEPQRILQPPNGKQSAGLDQFNQSEWIRRYVFQQEEEEREQNNASKEDGHHDSDWELWADPRARQRRVEESNAAGLSRAASIPAEFQKAKQTAAEAKRLGNKEKQATASRLLQQLKQEAASLGLSEDLLRLGLRSGGEVGASVNSPTKWRQSGGLDPTAWYVSPEEPNCPVNGVENVAATGLVAFATQSGTTAASVEVTGKDTGEESRIADEAKRLGNKEKPATTGRLLQQLKQEAVSLGLSEDLLHLEGRKGCEAGACVNSQTEGSHSGGPQPTTRDVTTIKGVENLAATSLVASERQPGAITASEDMGGKDTGEDSSSADEEGIALMFDDESPSEQALPETVRSIQLEQKAKALVANSLSRKDERKGKSRSTQSHEGTLRQPKVLLQQQCQKHAWGAPKYERLHGTRNGLYLCSVTVIRTASGRGKSKVAGGPVLITLPQDQDGFQTLIEAQDAVAAWALFSLLPDLPLYRILPDPYRALYLHWLAKGEKATKEAADAESNCRSSFIDTLLSSTSSQPVPNKPPSREIAPPSPLEQSGPQRRQRSRPAVEELGRNLLQAFKERQSTNDYKQMMAKRDCLPMAKVRAELLTKISENDVVVVSGETGCGKTTQVPQYILDDRIMAGMGGTCNIICTQPRRIAAISVAERVAVERCEPSPGNSGSLVGYQVRLDAACTSSTKILFCTTGILLRRFDSDLNLTEVSHVVVDEVHERNVLGDFLLIILKDLLERRREMGIPLKVVIMSATLDTDLFSQYFGGCPVVSVKGRTHPVTTKFLEDIYEWLDYRLTSDSSAAVHHSHRRQGFKSTVGGSRGRQNLIRTGFGDESLLEEAPVNPLFDEQIYKHYSSKTRQTLARVNEEVIDYDLLEDLIIAIDEHLEPGALLVFLPGQAEIQLILDRLRVSKRFGGPAAHWLLPLHSSVSTADQRKVFASPETGVRKIVLATNIAEASITIDDVVHVIDCGKHKENRFDPRRGMTSLVEAWISQANAKQRSGRAGRVQPGNCFCLYTRHRFENLMRPFQTPEILRVPLVDLCLQIKVLLLGDVSSFLQKAPERPTAEAVQSALSTLHQVGALDENAALTSLGYHLAALPVDVHIGKMILYGAMLGCLSPVLTVAACLSHRSPFVVPQDQKEEAVRAQRSLLGEAEERTAEQSIWKGQQSDHLAMVAAYDGWRRKKGAKAARAYCTTYFLSAVTLSMLRDMRTQFAFLLKDIGFVQEVAGATSGDWIDDVDKPFNRNSKHPAVVKAAICAGLFPQVAAMDEDSIATGHASALSLRAGLSSGRRPRWSDGQREVFIHPSSINSSVFEFRHPFLLFHEKVNTSRVYLRDTTVASPYTLLLFGGLISVQHQAGRVVVDGWLKMRAPAQTAVYFKELRLALDSIMREKIGAPQGTWSENASRFIPIITRLLIDEDKPNVV